jgi:hypothetical protein
MRLGKELSIVFFPKGPFGLKDFQRNLGGTQSIGLFPPRKPFGSKE